jgi:hypothetical protein
MKRKMNNPEGVVSKHSADTEIAGVLPSVSNKAGVRL